MKIRKSRSEMAMLISSLKVKGYEQVSYEKFGQTEKLVLQKKLKDFTKVITITMSANGWTEVV